MVTAFICCITESSGSEPDPKDYWDVDSVRPGMIGKGRTVMLGTKLEEFNAEILGVMRDVTPGRDMVLCRLSGCNLEHAGIIEGMSGSPIYLEGKLLGAVSYAWEFAKEPIAGVTPFSQMVKYARTNERLQILSDFGSKYRPRSTQRMKPFWFAGLADRRRQSEFPELEKIIGGNIAGMKAIAAPLVTRGFSNHSLSALSKELLPLGMSPVAGGAVSDQIVRAEGDRPLVPGAPLVIGLVTGDFDVSGVGTVTHVEGKRVYGFGHSMLNLGRCDFPMMTGYIHTVYPRTSVSMKIGSPLKVVGVIDTDVSTTVCGLVGQKPDTLPMAVRVKTGRFSDAQKYNVKITREPHLLPTLIRSVLFNSIDSEGNLPDAVTAQTAFTISLKERDPISLRTTSTSLREFEMLGELVDKITHTPFGEVRIERVDCEIELDDTSHAAEIESLRLASLQVEPGGTVKVTVTVRTPGEDREKVEMALPVADDLPEGVYQLTACDCLGALRHYFDSAPYLAVPRDLDGWLRALRIQCEFPRSAIYLHIPTPYTGLVVEGQALSQLPGSIQAVFSSSSDNAPIPRVRSSINGIRRSDWVIEGASSISFMIKKNRP
jgi:hypothetical protein